MVEHIGRQVTGEKTAQTLKKGKREKMENRSLLIHYDFVIYKEHITLCSPKNSFFIKIRYLYLLSNDIK